MNVPTEAATDYRGSGEIVEFVGTPENWSDAAWGVWCECEAELARANACEIATPRHSTIVTIVTEQEAGDFQRNWLSWKFATEVPIVLVLVGIAQEDYWLPESEHAQVICVTDEQASHTGALLRLVAASCQTDRVIFVSPLGSALPGAELWRTLPDGRAAIHFPSKMRQEVAVTGNRFVPQAYFVAISLGELRSLANCCSDVVPGELSRIFFEWAASREADIVFSSMDEFGWQFSSASLLDEASPKAQAADRIIRARPDGMLQLADDVVVISLPERTDRQERVTEMMANEGVWFRFVDGVRVADAEIEPIEVLEVGRQGFKMAAGFEKYLRGMAGCRRAHIRQLEAAIAAGLKSLLIIEDDCVFEDEWRELLEAALRELPANWLQLYLSGSSFRPASHYSPNLERLNGAYQTTAILYSEAGIAAALNCLRNSRSEIDHWMGNHLHPFGNSYVLKPQITSQKGGVSDIMGFDRGTTA